MHRKRILLASDSVELIERMREYLSATDVEIHASDVASFSSALDSHELDLVVVDVARRGVGSLDVVEARLAEEGALPILAVIDASDLPTLRLPVRVPSDFILMDATPQEFVARVKHLIWPGEEANSTDFIVVDRLSINLATYQVQVDGHPVDLTYLEYALLAFLVTHPGRTYSRDALLRRVWGFEYYGGSRTVDVHVRRIRAKLGPEISQRLETVRGVGYLWNA